MTVPRTLVKRARDFARCLIFAAWSIRLVLCYRCNGVSKKSKRTSRRRKKREGEVGWLVGWLADGLGEIEREIDETRDGREEEEGGGDHAAAAATAATEGDR